MCKLVEQITGERLVHECQNDYLHDWELGMWDD
jgi:hypothetical protein